MVQAGVSPALIGRVARLQVFLGKARNSAELTERRRAQDRERKRQKSSEISAIPEANDAGIAPRNSAEAGKVRTDDSQRSKESVSKDSDSQERDSQRSKESVVARQKRATRLVEGQKINDQDFAFARTLNASDAEINAAWIEFVDYWIAIPGQRGAKLNWPATWRNRARSVLTKGRPNGQRRQPKRTVHEAADDLLAKMRALDAEPPDLRDGTGKGPVRQLPPR